MDWKLRRTKGKLKFSGVDLNRTESHHNNVTGSAKYHFEKDREEIIVANPGEPNMTAFLYFKYEVGPQKDFNWIEHNARQLERDNEDWMFKEFDRPEDHIEDQLKGAQIQEGIVPLQCIKSNIRPVYSLQFIASKEKSDLNEYLLELLEGFGY